VLRRIFGPTRDEVTGEWKDYLTRSLMTCTPPPKYHLDDQIEKNEMGGACSTFGRGEVHTGF